MIQAKHWSRTEATLESRTRVKPPAEASAGTAVYAAAPHCICCDCDFYPPTFLSIHFSRNMLAGGVMDVGSSHSRGFLSGATTSVGPRGWEDSCQCTLCILLVLGRYRSTQSHAGAEPEPNQNHTGAPPECGEASGCRVCAVKPHHKSL